MLAGSHKLARNVFVGFKNRETVRYRGQRHGHLGNGTESKTLTFGYQGRHADICTYTVPETQTFRDNEGQDPL